MKKSVTIDEFDEAVIETAAKLTIEHMDKLQATLLLPLQEWRSQVS